MIPYRARSSALGQYHEYYKKGSWRCPLSPTGGHHWLIEGSRWGKCKYCKTGRDFATDVNGTYEYACEVGESQVGAGIL